MVSLVTIFSILENNLGYAQSTNHTPSPISNELEIVTEKLIRSQIMAFQSADVDTAYSFASPFIKLKFTNSETFGQMVKSAYPVIWAAKEFRFIQSMMVSDIIVQRVLFIDNVEKIYVFDYLLKKFEDKWLINGVYPVKNYSSGV